MRCETCGKRRTWLMPSTSNKPNLTGAATKAYILSSVVHQCSFTNPFFIFSLSRLSSILNTENMSCSQHITDDVAMWNIKCIFQNLPRTEEKEPVYQSFETQVRMVFTRNSSQLCKRLARMKQCRTITCLPNIIIVSSVKVSLNC